MVGTHHSDYLKLFQAHQVEQPELGLQDLISIAEGPAEQEREAMQLDRVRALAPFADRIAEISEKFSPEQSTVGTGIRGRKPSYRMAVNRWIEDYVLENGELLTGVHQVSVISGRTPSIGIDRFF